MTRSRHKELNTCLDGNPQLEARESIACSARGSFEVERLSEMLWCKVESQWRMKYRSYWLWNTNAQVILPVRRVTTDTKGSNNTPLAFGIKITRCFIALNAWCSTLNYNARSTELQFYLAHYLLVWLSSVLIMGRKAKYATLEDRMAALRQQKASYSRSERQVL